jgi:hypothetical protein
MIGGEKYYWEECLHIHYKITFCWYPLPLEVEEVQLE